LRNTAAFSCPLPRRAGPPRRSGLIHKNHNGLVPTSWSSLGFQPLASQAAQFRIRHA
jgi:hypothetical protein